MKKQLFCVLLSGVLMVGCKPHVPAPLEGAEWIGTEEVLLQAPYLTEFDLTMDVALTDERPTAVLLFGGNDERLLSADRNHMGVSSKRDEVMMVLAVNREQATLSRRGYDRDGKEHTFGVFPIPESFRSGDLHIAMEVTQGEIMLSVNDSLLGSTVATPHGQKSGDFIVYPALCELGSEGEATISNIEIRNLRHPHTLFYAKDSLMAGSPLFDPSRLGTPVLKTCFLLKDKEITKATIYATARGIYELYLNGARVGNDYFAPGVSQYNKTHYYQTYDVKPMLEAITEPGDIELRGLLGEGWWMGPIGYWARGNNHFGDQLALRAQLVVEYADGDVQVVNTNTQDWLVATDGEIRYSGRFNGEIIDARMTASDWQPARRMLLEGHVSEDSAFHMPAVNDYSHYQLLPQPDAGVVERRRLTAQQVLEPRKGVFIYDMGQNMAGLPLITFRGLAPGQKVSMRYAEVLYPDMKEYALNKGMVMMENIRGAFATDVYIAEGADAETFAPHFTLHGYRYVEITGIDRPLPLEDVQGRVLSSIELTADFECSNPLVNRLWQNICWSTLGNFISIPTDCPQRNERLGWGGDINVFSRTSTYITGNYDFLRRHMRNITDCQDANGDMPDVAPVNGAFGGYLWGAAGIAIPYEAWRQTGRTEIIEDNYEAMARYIDYARAHYIEESTNLFVQDRFWGGLGDWLNLEYGKLDRSALYECYYFFNLKMMAEMAHAIGNEADAQRYVTMAEERKAFYLATYIDSETGIARYSNAVNGREGEPCDYEASYVLPLAFGMVDDSLLRQKMTDRLVMTIERENTTDQGVVCPPYSLMTGFVTTAWISKALSDNGRADVAYKLLQNRKYPSWLYPVTQGATTIWERLNSYNDFEGFGGNNSMNSFNHYSFGAVGQWMMSAVLGLERDPEQAGFAHFIWRPIADPTSEMTFARGYITTEQGVIRSAWERTDKGIRYTIELPEGCSATMLINGETRDLASGKYVIEI